MIEKLALSLLLTWILEMLYALGWGVRGKDLLLILIMNTLTNPLVVLWNSQTVQTGYVISTLLPELAAIAVEALILKKFSKNITYPALLAVCINPFSYIIGLMLNYFIYF